MSEYGFKRKTICKVLGKKVEAWLDSITDLDVAEAARKDVIVTGGSITSMLLGEEINDFDLYFKTKETTLAVAKYYSKVFFEQNGTFLPQVEEVVMKNAKGNDEQRIVIKISNGTAESKDAKDTPEYRVEEEFGEGIADILPLLDSAAAKQVDLNDQVEEKPKYRPIFLSQNAITLTDKVQIVIRFYGSPDQIHENYDFEHCKHVWDHHNRNLILNQKGLECMMSRTLIYTGSLYPICSLFRTRKFINRGWRISAGELLKMSWQISELDLKSVPVIVEQLTGCDLNYLRGVIWEIEQARAQDEDFDITSSYLCTIIDKIFNE